MCGQVCIPPGTPRLAGLGVHKSVEGTPEHHGTLWQGHRTSAEALSKCGLERSGELRDSCSTEPEPRCVRGKSEEGRHEDICRHADGVSPRRGGACLSVSPCSAWGPSQDVQAQPWDGLWLGVDRQSSLPPFQEEVMLCHPPSFHIISEVIKQTDQFVFAKVSYALSL